ncbi:MAG: DVU0298 family protein [Thermoleophilia bacterium]
MASSLKSELLQALRKRDDERIAGLARRDKRTFAKLIAMAYNKDELLCWRAIEAMGAAARAVAVDDNAAVRNVVQRILWSAREESGGMGWSAPELLAEIAIAAPRYFPDIPPIIISLHSEDEENVFLKGVLWAAGRMGEAGIAGIAGSEELIRKSLAHEDSAVRGIAAWAAGRTDIDAREALDGMSGDESSLTIYKDGQLASTTVGRLAQEALAAKSGLSSRRSRPRLSGGPLLET